MGRILLFGGTFDPIHDGHLSTARAAREETAARLVLFIPAAQSPHKVHHVPTSAAHRLAMIQLAVGDDPTLAVSDIEIMRSPPSYTIDTVEALSLLYPRSELVLLMGADQLPRLHAWHKINQLLELASIAVLRRPGHEFDLSMLTQTLGPRLVRRIQFLSTPLLHISATDIRHRVVEGEPISSLVPATVEHYIREHGLYQK